jgi:hypothetical protein
MKGKSIICFGSLTTLRPNFSLKNINMAGSNTA